MKMYVLFKVNHNVVSFPEDCEMVCCSSSVTKIDKKCDDLNAQLLDLNEEPDYYYEYYEVDVI